MGDISDLLMPIAIGIIMFGIGLNLKFKNFKDVFIHPKAIITGLVCQLGLLPLIAFAIVYFWPMDPVYKVGAIVIASAPGGTASNLVTHMLNGRVALSVSLTSFNSFAILFTIPFFVDLALSTFLGKDAQINFSFTDTMQEIIGTVIIPVILGIFVHEYTPEKYIDRLKKPLKIGMPILLFSVVGIALFLDDGRQSIAYLDNLELVIPLLVLNLTTMLVGFYVARTLGIEYRSNLTIAIEMGLQNSALAIFIAAALLDNPKIELMAVIYSSFSFFTTWFCAWLMKRYLAPKSTAQ